MALADFLLLPICFLCFLGRGSMVTARILRVQVVSLGTVVNSSTTSLAFTAPAMQTVLAEFAASKYVGVLNMSLTLLYDPTITDADAMPDYCDDMLASGYYREESINDYDATVIVIPGNWCVYKRMTSISLPNITRFTPYAIDRTLFIAFTGGAEDLPINNLAMNGNLLYITCGSSRPIITEESPTWVTTTAFGTSQAINFHRLVLARFNWTTLFQVLDTNAIPVFQSAADALREAFENESGFQFTAAEVDCSNDTEVKDVLRQFVKTSRVLLFFGHAERLRHLMIAAHRLILTGKDFVYIVLEPYHHHIIGNFTWEFGDPDDALVMHTSQLLMSPADPSLLVGKEAEYFGPIWRQMTRDEFNYTYAKGETFGPTVASSHYTMDFLAVALKESLQESNFDYSNGTAIAELFYDRTFSVDGEDFYINQFGRRLVKWCGSYFDHTKGSFVPFLAQNAGAINIEEVTLIEWYDGHILPLNEPLCGFQQLRKLEGCLLYRTTADNTSWTYLVGTLGSCAVIVICVIAVYRRKRLKQGNTWELDGSQFEQHGVFFTCHNHLRSAVQLCVK